MTRKELKELLDSLSNQLRGEIEHAQNELKSARSITSKINGLLAKSTDIVATFEDPESGFKAKLDKSTLDTDRITVAADAAEKTVSDIQASLSTVQGNVTAMNTAYTEFEAVRAKIDDPTTGLAAMLNEGTTHLSQIRSNATDAAALTKTIRDNLTTVQANVTAMNTAYTEFEAVRAKIDDPTTGLTATLATSQKVKTDIDAVKQESETLYAEISRYKDSAAKNVASIQAIKASSDQALEAITTNQNESESLKDKIAAIFKLVSQGGHANYFDERRKRLEYASWAWLAATIVFISIAVYLAVHIIVPLTTIDHHAITTSTIQELIVRFSVITPFLILGIFGANNYSKERRLSEHYAFRAVSALSIEGSLLLLSRSLNGMTSGNKDGQIIDFAVSTMKLIYSEPQEQNKTTRFNLKGGNKIVQVGTELNQTLGDLTEAITKEGKSSV